jgi:positive regulator of sigma E activity
MNDIAERHGTVVGFADGLAQISLAHDAGCGGCASRGHCASGGAAPQLIALALPEHTRLGDAVTIATPSSSLALAALTGYLLPPLCLLLGALGAASCYAGDLAAVLGAAFGLLAGLLLVRLIAAAAVGRGFASPVCHFGSSSDFQPVSLPGEHP